MNKQLDNQTTNISDEDALPLSQQVFAEYSASHADRTRKRQRKELEGLREFLQHNGHLVGNLAFDAAAWAEVESNKVEQYLAWLKEKQYTASSISNLLYTIRAYARIATEYGFFPLTEYQRLDKINIEPDREGQPRIGRQKSTPLSISEEQAQRLLNQPATRRGRTDALIMALFLRCGLWPREVAALNRHSINVEKGTLTFYDHNAEEEHTLRLDSQTHEIAERYLRDDSPYEALFVGNRKESNKQQRLTDRALNARVRTLGERVDLPTLSPHDCHMYWEQQRDRTQQKHFLIPGAPGKGKSIAALRLLLEKGEDLSQPSVEQPEHVVTERPPRRKSRPDIWNRRSFEESMLQRGVAESMIAPFISEYRLLIPLMVMHLDKEAFLQQAQQDRRDLKLSPETDGFWKEALEQIELWMREQVEHYRTTRQED